MGLMDSISREFAREIVSQLPYPECEICKYATRSLDDVGTEDDPYHYIMRVTCKRECESEVLR